MRLIDADALERKLRSEFETDTPYAGMIMREIVSAVVDIIDCEKEESTDTKTADWFACSKDLRLCSNCGYKIFRIDESPYCPNCGYRMTTEKKPSKPTITARWVDDADCFICSNCGAEQNYPTSVCHTCGAAMRPDGTARRTESHEDNS